MGYNYHTSYKHTYNLYEYNAKATVVNCNPQSILVLMGNTKILHLMIQSTFNRGGPIPVSVSVSMPIPVIIRSIDIVISHSRYQTIDWLANR